MMVLILVFYIQILRYYVLFMGEMEVQIELRIELRLQLWFQLELRRNLCADRVTNK